MSRGIILGSGIIGLLAKELFPSAKIIPFGQSRFFSFKTPLDDNCIVRDEALDDFIGHLGGKISGPYKTAYSLGGQLLDHSPELCDAWLRKVFGIEMPPHANMYLSTRGTKFIYDIRVNKLYATLKQKHLDELKETDKLGKPTAIKDGTIAFTNATQEYDWIISTIPLNILLRLVGRQISTKYRQVWYFHIQTNSVNLDGANQALVVDDYIKFHKVSNIAPGRFIFHCLDEIPIPGPYFMQFMPTLDIIDGTTVTEALPLGGIYKQEPLNNNGIYCVGSYAENDWCADIGSNIMKLLRLRSALPV